MVSGALLGHGTCYRKATSFFAKASQIPQQKAAKAESKCAFARECMGQRKSPMCPRINTQPRIAELLHKWPVEAEAASGRRANVPLGQQ